MGDHGAGDHRLARARAARPAPRARGLRDPRRAAAWSSRSRRGEPERLRLAARPARRRARGLLPASSMTVATTSARPRGSTNLPSRVSSIAVQEPRDPPGGEPAPLPVVERGIRHRRGVLQRGQHRRSQVGHRRCRRPAPRRRAHQRRGLWPGARRGRGVSRSTAAPTRTGPTRAASRSTSRGDSRCRLDRYAHWSSSGSRVPRSRKTVAPSLREPPLQRRGDEVADPADAGSTSWEGNSRS